MRYEVHPLTVWQSAYRARMGATAKVSYRVVDTHTVRHSPRDGVRAWSYDEAVARQVCDMLNGVNNHATHWKNSYQSLFDSMGKVDTRWQATLDHTNSLLRETREACDIKAAEADMLRGQLFEARAPLLRDTQRARRPRTRPRATNRGCPNLRRVVHGVQGIR